MKNAKKCAYPGCNQPARGFKKTSCCSDEHARKFYRLEYKYQKVETGRCALPGCENQARTRAANSTCCQEHSAKLQAQIRKMAPHKCALPGCDNQACSPRKNSTCCKPHQRRLQYLLAADILNAEMPKCAVPGCNNPARSRKRGSACSEECSRKMRYFRAKNRFYPCAFPGCDKKARNNKPGSTCSVEHERARKTMLYSIKYNAPAPEPFQRPSSSGETLNFRSVSVNEKRATRRVDAIVIASQQPGYNRYDIADIHRRVEEILGMEER